MSGVKGKGATKRAAQIRRETDDLVMSLLEKHGKLTAEQIRASTRLSTTTVKYAIERLRQVGLVCKMAEKKMPGRNGKPPCEYGIGIEDDLPIKRRQVVVNVRRDPMDVALFGEYAPATRAEAA